MATRSHVAAELGGPDDALFDMIVVASIIVTQCTKKKKKKKKKKITKEQQQQRRRHEAGEAMSGCHRSQLASYFKCR